MTALSTRAYGQGTAVVNTIPVGSGPIGVSSDGTHVWVANESSDTVSEIQISTVATLLQGSPTSAAVADGAGYSGRLTVTNPNGTTSYPETASADSSDVVVDASGAITAAKTLAPGTYTISGVDFDTAGDTGSWSFTLHVGGGTITKCAPTSRAVPSGYYVSKIASRSACSPARTWTLTPR